jgi:hypothetical protein
MAAQHLRTTKDVALAGVTLSRNQTFKLEKRTQSSPADRLLVFCPETYSSHSSVNNRLQQVSPKINTSAPNTGQTIY